MDILFGVLVSAAIQTGLPCIEAPINLTGSRGVTAKRQQPNRAKTSGFGAHGVQRRGFTLLGSNGNHEDFLFYLSSHAQVVSDLSEGLWMPWLELHTFASHRGKVSPESKRATTFGVGGANNACDLLTTRNDVRGKRSLSLHVPSAMVRERPEPIMVANKR